MSTKCKIGKENRDGTVTAIYCHWDGYPSYVGKMLLANYDEENMEKLLALGDISTLGRKPESDPELWDFKKEDNSEYCRAYKDRNESDIDAATYPNARDYENELGDVQFCYLLKDGKWQVSEGDGFLPLD